MSVQILRTVTLAAAVYRAGQPLTLPEYAVGGINLPAEKELNAWLPLPTRNPAMPVFLELVWGSVTPWVDWVPFRAQLADANNCPATPFVPGMLYLPPTDVPSVTILPSRELDNFLSIPFVLTLAVRHTTEPHAGRTPA